MKVIVGKGGLVILITIDLGVNNLQPERFRVLQHLLKHRVFMADKKLPKQAICSGLRTCCCNTEKKKEKKKVPEHDRKIRR